MDPIPLLIDLHRDGDRQGPGGSDETRLAIALSGLKHRRDLRIADIGCGTGASTLVLARELDGDIIAVDFLPEFLDRLNLAAQRDGLAGHIETHAASMEALNFENSSLDAIWSEGAIYNMGFENGIKAWQRFLKPGGILAVSELTWFTARRPPEIERHWQHEYPEVDTVSAKISLLEENGYALLGYFPLPENCWHDNYYRPMQARFDGFLARHDHSDAAAAIVEAEQAEIALFERFSGYYGYGFYIAKRVGD